MDILRLNIVIETWPGWPVLRLWDCLSRRGLLSKNRIWPSTISIVQVIVIGKISIPGGGPGILIQWKRPTRWHRAPPRRSRLKLPPAVRRSDIHHAHDSAATTRRSARDGKLKRTRPAARGKINGTLERKRICVCGSSSWPNSKLEREVIAGNELRLLFGGDSSYGTEKENDEWIEKKRETSFLRCFPKLRFRNSLRKRARTKYQIRDVTIRGGMNNSIRASEKE